MPGEVNGAGVLAEVNSWQPGDEFRWHGERHEILHVQMSSDGVHVFVDGGKPGDPPREFHAPVGAVRRVWRHAPPELRIHR